MKISSERFVFEVVRVNERSKSEIKTRKLNRRMLQ